VLKIINSYSHNSLKKNKTYLTFKRSPFILQQFQKTFFYLGAGIIRFTQNVKMWMNHLDTWKFCYFTN